jgi:hypothetical protein
MQVQMLLQHSTYAAKQFMKINAENEAVLSLAV